MIKRVLNKHRIRKTGTDGDFGGKLSLSFIIRLINTYKTKKFGVIQRKCLKNIFFILIGPFHSPQGYRNMKEVPVFSPLASYQILFP